MRGETSKQLSACLRLAVYGIKNIVALQDMRQNIYQSFHHSKTISENVNCIRIIFYKTLEKFH